MIDRVHGLAARLRADAAPPVAPRLADLAVLMIRVGDGADRRPAIRAYDAHLAGGEPELGHALVAADDLGVGAGRARDLAAGPHLHLDVVDDGADGNVRERQRVAGLDVGLLAGLDRVAGLEALRRQDIRERAVGVFDERDPRRAVGIVLEPLDRRGPALT